MATYTRFPKGPTASRFSRAGAASPEAETDADTGTDTGSRTGRQTAPDDGAPHARIHAQAGRGSRFARGAADQPGDRTDGRTDDRGRDRGGNRGGNRPGGSEAPMRGAAAQAGQTAQAGIAMRKRLLTLFMLTLFTPLMINLGSLFLNPHRIYLVLAFVPLVLAWLGGKAGRLYPTDFLFLGYVLWMAVSIFAVHGVSRIQLIGINTIEAFGAYLAGRVLVRGPEEYNRLLKVLTIAMLIFLPAAVIESNTGIRIFSKIADAIGQTYGWVHAQPYYQKRLGMYRSQMVFEHPILFGVFSVTTFGLLYFRTRPNGKLYGFRTAFLSVGNTFFALSSGPLLSLVTQIGIVTWDKIMRGIRSHWKVLIGLVIFGYVFVDALSNRTPFEVFISYATFNAGNGYMRIIIFNAGIQNVWANPIFGLGMNDWVRPAWLPPSVDNFWLLTAMRHGIPGFLFMAGAMLGTIIGLGRLQISDPVIAAMRKGAVVSFIGLALSLVTVHIWGPTYAYVCFLMGAVGWIRNHGEKRGDTPHARSGPARHPPERTAGPVSSRSQADR